MSEQTPMMRQYAHLKERYNDAVLFFRLGDFYEMFRHDAEDASRVLGLTLTQRQGIPMCGVPYHSARGYISRLLATGRKVAICEQTRVPEKGLAEREVVEVITPGTVTDEDYLEQRRNNYIVALSAARDLLLLTWADVSTGELGCTRLPRDTAELRAELARLSPRELLLQQSLVAEGGAAAGVLDSLESVVVDRIPDWHFDIGRGFELLCRHLGVVNLAGFGLDANDAELAPLGVLCGYIVENTGGGLAHVRRIDRKRSEGVVHLDESTQRNLEIAESGPRGAHSLLKTVDETVTPMGSRLLSRRLLAPLCDAQRISRRLEAVETLYHEQAVLTALRRALGSCPDLERLAARIVIGRAHAKDLKAAGRSIEQAEEIAAILERLEGEVQRPEGLRLLDPAAREQLNDLASKLSNALVDNPSTLLTEGNMIRPEYDEELGRLAALRENSEAMLEKLLEREREQSGVSSLKLKYNRVIGYFFEVPATRAGELPEHFVRRQSMANAERFTTSELSRLEDELSTAAERAVERERELFLELRESVAGYFEELSDLAAALARLDVHASNAAVATLRGYRRPHIDEGEELAIERGRHPVVEAHLPGGEFVPNSLSLASQRFVLLTGPNMAGKSTYLRQNALIVLLAQSGAFVPAEEAHIGVVDRIFCRVGASDNLARGESTFLVEMNETANILRFATSRSLVIMDEVGRGTGTSDGVSIARAVSEFLLSEVGCRTLFATHYHELTRLEHPSLLVLRMAVSEENGEVLFLRRVEPGPSHRSYGIHVARLAGLPEPVVYRARQLLEQRGAEARGESDGEVSDAEHNPAAAGAVEQPRLFSDEEWLPDEVRSLDLNRITPMDALRLLERWQKLLG